MDQIQLETTIRELCEWARQQPEIIALYLFGSWAEEGWANALSDVDVAILVREGISKEALWRLEERWLTEAASRVDLSVLNLAPLAFRFEVITRGRLLWARERWSVAEFESYTRRRYWDFAPYATEYQRCFQGRLMEARNEVEREEYRATLEQIRAVHRRVKTTATANKRSL